MYDSNPISSIISLSAYKREKGIAAPRSPYYTLNATKAEISAAFERASKYLSEPVDRSERTPYAILFGFEDKSGRVKLLKQFCSYPNREILEQDVGRKSLTALVLIAEKS